MKTILIIVASIGVVLLLTEIVFKKTLLKWKDNYIALYKKINKEKYRKDLGKLPTLEELKLNDKVKATIKKNKK